MRFNKENDMNIDQVIDYYKSGFLPTLDLSDYTEDDSVYCPCCGYEVLTCRYQSEVLVTGSWADGFCDMCETNLSIIIKDRRLYVEILN